MLHSSIMPKAFLLKVIARTMETSIAEQLANQCLRGQVTLFLEEDCCSKASSIIHNRRNPGANHQGVDGVEEIQGVYRTVSSGEELIPFRLQSSSGGTCDASIVINEGMDGVEYLRLFYGR